jgi:hypothetical protein
VRKLEKREKNYNMKFCKVSLFLALLVAVCLPAIGQTEMHVNVPFNFIAAGKTLPAGHYRVARLSSSDSAWYISNDHTGAMIIVEQAESTQDAHRLSLVFLQAGGAYSLVEIWNHHSGWSVPQSKVKQNLVAKDESKDSKYVEIGAE